MLGIQDSTQTPAEAIRERDAEIERLRAALTEIAEGKGRFSNDPFTHACNTIEDMVGIASAALLLQHSGGEK